MNSDKDDSNIERYQYSTTTTNTTTNDIAKQSIWHSFTDSFKPAIPNTNEHILKSTNKKDYSELTDIEKINLNAANTNLQRKLKTRHLQMIAIGSSIGTGLFVGTGQALANGGPLAIVLAWTITALAVYTTVQGLGELSVSFPVSGSFNLFASKFIEPAVGFAVGWNYFLQFFVLLPLELVAGAITVKYWNSSINSDVFVIIFWIGVVFVTLLGPKGYGEAESIFSLVKVLAVIGFIILGIVLICGGGPTHEFIGGKYWRSPGLFANGFKGFASVLVTALFSYGGTEMIALTAAETNTPHKTLPKAIRQVFWRIVIFYLGSITMISCLVPYDDKRLFGKSSVDATASAFTIAIVNGGIKGLPSVINAVILISVLSVGNASVYATSRSLNSLAEQGMAPKWTGYVDRAGRPLVAILITDIFGLFALIAAKNDAQEEAFNWLLALSGLSSIFTWMSINVSHLRFRRAMKVQQRSLNELPFTSQVGIWGSWYGLILNTLFLIAQFYIALFPLGGKPNAYDFFLSYLGLPVVLMSWLCYKIWKRDWTLFIRAKDIDIDTGRVNIDMDVLQQEIAEEKAKLAEKSIFIRIYRFFC